MKPWLNVQHHIKVGMVTHACNPSLRTVGMKAEDQKYKVILSDTVSLRPAGRPVRYFLLTYVVSDVEGESVIRFHIKEQFSVQ